MDTIPSPSGRKSFRRLRAVLLGVAGLITLVAVGYTIENWRGKRAWENCKRELESKKEVLTWKAYIPPPVPDDQNIFKAPNITDWFVGRGTNLLSSRLSVWTLSKFVHPRNIIAQVTVVPSKATIPSEEADVVLRYADSVLSSATESPETVREKLRKIVEEAAGQAAKQISEGTWKGAQGLTFSATRLNPLKPVRVVVRTDKTPNPAEIAGFFPRYAEVLPGQGPYPVRLEAQGSNSFGLFWSPDVYSAAEYVAWSGQLEPELETIRSALKRPYARIDCDYQRAYAISNVNFVTIRMVGQTLAQRAQCHLLLDQPDQALDDLALIHGLSRLLEPRPTGQPMTLVAAMINVAITGLYVDTIADGFRMKAWREPQLAALEQQLKEIKLSPLVRNAFKYERAGMCDTFETTSARQLSKMFVVEGQPASLWEKIQNPKYLLVLLAPRGWTYQNMAATALLEQKVIETFDAANSAVVPARAKVLELASLGALKKRSPYSFLAAMVVPNFIRAAQTETRTQTLVDEAFVACALERHRLAHGQYPEALEAVVPEFADQLPPDIINGQPLKYRRTPQGQFVLYSIGWNERDDGGADMPRTTGGGMQFDQGDWLWCPQPK